MRLNLLCQTELAYRLESVLGSTFVMVRPYGTEEGSGYGEGGGRFDGESLSGVARWVNHPHRRSDEVMLPNLHGVLKTDDGAVILFSMGHGRTIFDGDTGDQLLKVWFETEDDRYLWLNDAFCVLEGAYDAVKSAFVTRIYQCVNELVAAPDSRAS